MSATVQLDEGENVICTITNSRVTGLTIVKETRASDGAVIASSQVFRFTASGGFGEFALDTDTASASTSDQVAFPSLSNGAEYAITEQPLDDWVLEQIICLDEDGQAYPDAVVSLSTLTVIISYRTGKLITCTFVNTPIPRNSITLVKEVAPPAILPDNFEFTFSGGNVNAIGIFLDDDNDFTLSNRIIFDQLTPGAVYTATEVLPLPPSSEFVDVVCRDLDTDELLGSETSPTVAVSLGDGQRIICIFTNRQNPEAAFGRIRVLKDTLPAGDPTEFGFALTGGPSPMTQTFALSDTSPAHESGLIEPGAGYLVTETVPSGWTLTAASCDDGSPVSSIDVSAEETVTCIFTNTFASPSAITLVNFNAVWEGAYARVQWTTITEFDVWGYQLYRGLDNNFAHAILVSPDLIPGQGATGGSYTAIDTLAAQEGSFSYWLVELRSDGSRQVHGPIILDLSQDEPSIFMPLILR
jgi:hypothetical protein